MQRGKTADKLDTTFSDIDGHWAEYQILMAANDNVESKNHTQATASGMVLTDTTLSLETNQVKIDIDRKTGKVTAITNKYDYTNVMAASTSPCLPVFCPTF